VHIDDVATAVILSLDLLSRSQLDQQLVLTLDSAYEYTDADLDHWDTEGPGSTFPRRFAGWATSQAYSLANLLSELAAFGDSGPPHFTTN
jgi:hypothetical protein